jgi:hypothetical protein
MRGSRMGGPPVLRRQANTTNPLKTRMIPAQASRPFASLRAGSVLHELMPKKSARKLETTGLIVIAILILAITVVRYWHNINWSGR